MPRLLEVKGLTAGYGMIEVLHDMSVHIDEGEIVTIIGANGAGKTTTLHCLSGLVPARQGKILLRGQEIQNLPPHEIVLLGLSQSPEGRRIFPRLSVLENLQMGAFTRSDKPQIAKDIEHCYDLFPILKERQQQLGGTLSGGEQQMLAVARAILSRPKLLLLDEPSLGLAPLIVLKIFEVIRKLNQEGMSVILVEQNARMALKLAHRGYVLETGRITATGSGQSLLDDPKVQEAYLGH
ncbi:ABC transporter related protein [Pirellula staleyi DSM 6068]|uniref:ABC transporter related protein n=1 Tax=Pirellula staleyi (strain ATCC 27377 / DSM 6068 / ICPB 4128) TaxID=530564 RepID=D2R6Z0_PIRSD|nr:ATP-binding cassette domain-containing protein [Pirellula staleyi]ADB19193.1 ABC transporter related protein [Pirellula staleyi DSM 6068]